MHKNLFSSKNTLVILIIVFFCCTFLLCFINVRSTFGPIHFDDELIYWKIATRLFKGDFDISKDNHYPPLYPLSLIPAFYFFGPNNTYKAAKVINAIFIASAIFPSFLILRKFLEEKISLGIAIISILNPISIVISRVVISENLYYPLFLWAVFFSFNSYQADNKKNPIFQNIILGVILGLMLLTRYISLTIVPAFILIWWITRIDFRMLDIKKILRNLPSFFYVLIPIIFIFSFWLIRGLSQNVPVKELLGLTLTDHPNPNQLSIKNLIMWVIFYVSFSILIMSPYLSLFILFITRFKKDQDDSEILLWLVSVLIIVLSILIPSIMHSWRANYNYPIPIRLQGRYLLYFGPLFMFTFYIFIGRYKPLVKARISKWHYLIISMGMVFLSGAFLFLGFIFLDKPLSISISSPDGYLFGSSPILFILVVIVLNFFTLILITKNKQLLFSVASFLLVFLFVFGNVNIFNKILFPKQIHNHEVIILIDKYKELSGNSGFSKEEISLEIPNTTKATIIKYWINALQFNGYENIRYHLVGNNDLQEQFILRMTIFPYEMSLVNCKDIENDVYYYTSFSQSGFSYCIILTSL
ncbi:MAG: hypothetical protein Q8N39_08315 [Pelolinea sp.]|nr:hypothetical protein [Pelolinea sp.]